MRPFTIILCVAALLSLVRSAAPQGASASWKRDSALVFLHRSAGLVAPENTVPAFEAAVRQGADGIETDIRRTRDGAYVIYHDDWVLMQRGPAGKIEEMTLEETQRLDLGDRFGPRWRGLHPPLFEDLLRFAKANDLRLYLDIKSPNIYDEVMRMVREQGVLPLVHATGGQVPPGSYHLRRLPPVGSRALSPFPVADASYPSTPYYAAYPSTPTYRAYPSRPYFAAYPSAPFYSVRGLDPSNQTDPTDPSDETKQTNQPTPLPQLESASAERRRAARLALSRKLDRAALEPLLALAERDLDYTVRQDACWALGSLDDDRAAARLLRIAQTPYDPILSALARLERDPATSAKVRRRCELVRAWLKEERDGR